MKRNAICIASRRDFMLAAGCAAAAGVAPGRAAGQTLATPELREVWGYTALADKQVKCGICPRECVVKEGKRGHCNVHENRGGRYYTLVYGRPCATNNDPIEKKPFFHVYPGRRAFSIATVGCNIRCTFCQNWDISQADPYEVRTPYVTPQAVAAEAVRRGSKVVAYTYSEPTVFYEYMADCARAARDRGLGNVVVSNGFINAKPLEELLPLLTAYKIDLKAFTQRFYAKLCEGRLKPVLETLKRLAGSGVWFEIVMLVIPTQNDNMDEIKRMADWIVKELGPGVPLHFTRFHPAYKLRNLPRTPPATLHKARATALAQGVRFVYTGNMPGGEGENTYCPKCKTPVVKRYGHLVMADSLKQGRCPKCKETIPGVWN